MDYVQICHGFDCDASDIAVVVGSSKPRPSLIVLGPCLALGRSAAEKGLSYLTDREFRGLHLSNTEAPFWNIITEAGSGIQRLSVAL